MDTSHKRIFVGNLPCDMSETEIKDKFRKFGNVLKIEMKRGNEVSQSSYAFLDLEIDTRHLDSCFRSLSNENWNGHSVKLELAKESFLSRLQRERQQDVQKSQTNTPICVSKHDHLSGTQGMSQMQNPNYKPNKQQRLLNGDDNYGTGRSNRPITGNGYSPVEKQLEKGLLQKFESFSDVWKDPPTFNNHRKQENYDVDVDDSFEIVPQKEKKTLKDNTTFHIKPTHNNNFVSEEKRLKSIDERARSFLQQQEAVKLALASVDSKLKFNKKIVFDDGIDEIIKQSSDLATFDKPHDNTQGSKSQLFDEESAGEEDQDHNFKIKKQFEGKKGQKLLELQSKYANDRRFALDERFYDSEDNAEEEDQTNAAGDPSVEDERRRQIEILQSIVGENLPFIPEKRKLKQVNSDNMVVHYDPAREDHAKYEIKRQETKKVVVPSKKQERKQEARIEKKKRKRELPVPLVPTASKEKFYKVSDSLKESLKPTEAKGFSLLEMFGSTSDKDQNANEEAYSYTSMKKSKSIHQSSNPFKWDSSDSEDEADNPPPTAAKLSSGQQQQEGAVQAQGIWQETFFFTKNDIRLTEGLEFFRTKEPLEEDFTVRRRKLWEIVRAKVKHNLRKSQPIRRKLGGKKINRFRKK